MTLQHPEGMTSNRPNCGVVALSAATGIPYQDVFAWFASQRRGNWKGRTRSDDRIRFLDESGVDYEVSENLAHHFAGRTLLQFMAWSSNNGADRTFIVTTTGHVQVVQSGNVLDQRYVGHGGGYWGQRKRIQRFDFEPILEVFNKPKFDLNQSHQLAFQFAGAAA